MGILDRQGKVNCASSPQGRTSIMRSLNQSGHESSWSGMKIDQSFQDAGISLDPNTMSFTSDT